MSSLTGAGGVGSAVRVLGGALSVPVVLGGAVVFAGAVAFSLLLSEVVAFSLLLSGVVAFSLLLSGVAAFESAPVSALPARLRDGVVPPSLVPEFFRDNKEILRLAGFFICVHGFCMRSPCVETDSLLFLS